MLPEEIEVRPVHSPAPLREILAIALPLIVSGSSLMIMNFLNRVLVAWYSQDALAGVGAGGIACHTLIAVFSGTAGYVSTFVSQYHGAGRPDRVAASVWQGIYFSLLVWAGLALLALPAPALFRLVGHAPAVQKIEVTYFRIVILFSGLVLLNSVFSAFWSGRGRTRVVMAVNCFGLGLNVGFSYWFIFGGLGVPALGAAGAAWGSVLATAGIVLTYLVLWFSPRVRQEFSGLARRAWDRELFFRLLRYGLPSGAQFFMDILFFSVFVLLVGRLGTREMALTNIALSINQLAFMPMMGIQVAVTVLVGKYVGQRSLPRAQAIVRQAFYVILAYEVLVGAVYVGLPGPLLHIFTRKAGPEEVAYVMQTGRLILVLMAVYSVFDSLNLIYAGALRGAGDTRFIMLIGLVFTWVVFAPGMFLIMQYAAETFTAMWIWATVYVSALGLAFLLRYLGGAWKSMSVLARHELPPAVDSLAGEGRLIP